MREAISIIAGIIMALILTAPIYAGEASEPPAFGWPMSSPDSYGITANFDLDRSDDHIADWTGWTGTTWVYGHAYDNHSGTDWGMLNGTNLYAIADGKVDAFRESVPNDDHSGTGNYIILDHTLGGENWKSNCWHLSQWSVVPENVGDPVTKGQKIAESDNTGNSTGPHLHFGIENLSLSGFYTCPFYHGWWENDEFYYADGRPCIVYMNVDASTLNCRRGNSTGYDVVTQVTQNCRFIACYRDDWYCFFVPLPPAKPYESRDSGGGLASGYSESGAWANSSDKSTVTDTTGDANYVSLSGAGTRYSTHNGTGGSDTATFTWTAPQRGYYDVYTTWPSNANAKNVTYRVTDTNGTHDVFITQRGNYSLGGTGTHADPYIIESNPYIVNHTTIGGDDTWDSYSPVGSGIPEYGPERVYKFTTYVTTSLSVSVWNDNYPDKDADIHLLYSLDNNDCQKRADWSFEVDSLSPGTYYISVDSYGTDDSRATPYTLTVRFGPEARFANSWVKVGEYFYKHYDYNGSGSVQIREDTVDGKVNTGAEGRVYADAIKVVPKITYRSVWASDSYLTRIDTATDPEASVGIKVDQTTGNDSRDISDYGEVPIYADKGTGATNMSAIVGKAVTGQRFVCTQKSGDWYKVYLTNSCDVSMGWIYGDNLFIYHSIVVPVELSIFAIE